jgi:hypothetical protein
MVAACGRFLGEDGDAVWVSVLLELSYTFSKIGVYEGEA